jgi:outer membrane protein OmpA-like peptidoglycan-associated protein
VSPPVTFNGGVAAAMAPSALSGGGGKSQADTPKPPAPKLPAIYFATNRAKPLPASRPLVPKAARLIKQLPAGTVVEIAGYTDNVGSPPANMRLSQRRANAIRGALTRAGVDPAMLAAKGYGGSHPLTLAGEQETVEGRSNALAGDRGRNDRRVEFSISQHQSGGLP